MIELLAEEFRLERIGFQRTDLSIFKNFDFATRHRIQVRIEGFNILIQPRFGQPNGTLGGATFGQITTSDDGRVVQLGLKYTFWGARSR